MSVKTEISYKCRICLHEGNISIYNSDHSESRLRDNICIFGEIEVKKDDIFPKHLCQACFSALQAAIHFRRTAKETDRLLKLKSQSLASKNLQVILNGSKNGKQILIRQNNSRTQLKKKNLESAPVHNGKLIISHSKSEQMQSTAVDVKEGSETDDGMLSADAIQTDYGTHELESTVDIIEGSMQDVNKEHISEMKQIKNKLEFKEAVKRKLMLHSSKESPIKETNIVTRFKCEVCNELFKERCAYYDHRKRVHSTVQSISSNLGSVLKISSNDSDKLHVCDLCPRKFKQKDYLLKHKLMHERKGPLIPYAKHFKFIGVVNNEPMVECRICDQTIKKGAIPIHYKLLHKKSYYHSYLCDVCGKELSCNSNPEDHKSTHTNEFLFKCKLCPYKGRNKDLLRVHMRMHLEKYVSCDQCPKQFKYRSNLNRHVLRHYKPAYKCEVCKRQFYEKSALNSHYKIKHLEGNKPVPCELCDKVFSCRKNLLKHQFKVHDRKKMRIGLHLAHYIKQQN